MTEAEGDPSKRKPRQYVDLFCSMTGLFVKLAVDETAWQHVSFTGWYLSGRPGQAQHACGSVPGSVTDWRLQCSPALISDRLMYSTSVRHGVDQEGEARGRERDYNMFSHLRLSDACLSRPG